ncbi:MAG: hypothetical protein HUN05_18540 [Desulfobacter sp.]|nr:MAG: hypothetical protein HUN05_18540 [Desulfobacter sp.]
MKKLIILFLFLLYVPLYATGQQDLSDATANFYKSESITDKIKRKISPKKYWKAVINDYEIITSEISASIKEIKLELEKLRMTKDIEMRQAILFAKSIGEDPKQARIDFLETYKEDIEFNIQFIRDEIEYYRLCRSYLMVAKNELSKLE